jgi:hypothetical protein
MPHSRVNCQKRTNDSNPNSNKHSKKQATQSVIAKFASAHFQLKSEQANYCRTNFNRKLVSNFKSWGKSCDHNSINVCFCRHCYKYEIVSLIRSCVQFLLAAESTKFISVMSFGKELDKRRQRSESRSFHFKRQFTASSASRDAGARVGHRGAMLT